MNIRPKQPPDTAIEQAQEVTSPSACAFQTLNAPVSNTSSSSDARSASKNGKSAAAQVMEIPMEDLSLTADRQRRRSGPLIDPTAKRRTAQPSGRPAEVKKRSSSYSPHRKSQPKITSFTSSPSPQVMKAAVQRLEKRTKNLLQRPRSMSGPTDAATRVKNAVEEASANTSAELAKIGQQLLSMSKSPSPKSLTPASGPSVSLYHEPVHGRLSAPTLLPPSEFPYSMRQNSAPDVCATADLSTIHLALGPSAVASSPPKQSISDRLTYTDLNPTENAI